MSDSNSSRDPSSRFFREGSLCRAARVEQIQVYRDLGEQLFDVGESGFPFRGKSRMMELYDPVKLISGILVQPAPDIDKQALRQRITETSRKSGTDNVDRIPERFWTFQSHPFPRLHRSLADFRLMVQAARPADIPRRHRSPRAHKSGLGQRYLAFGRSLQQDRPERPERGVWSLAAEKCLWPCAAPRLSLAQCPPPNPASLCRAGSCPAC